MNIFRQKNKKIPGYETKVVGEYENLNELRSYLKKLSEDLEDNMLYKPSNYDWKRIKHLNRPLNYELIDLVLNEENKEIPDNSKDYINYIKKVPTIITQKNYDSLFDLVNNELKDHLFNKIKTQYDKIDDEIKKDYKLKLNEENIFHYLDMKYDESGYYPRGGVFIERWGFPVEVNNSDEINKFYITDNGNKILYDSKGGLIFKRDDKESLEDFITHGKKVKDMLESKEKESFREKYQMMTDYLFS
ncbi:MAG: hypothetical protein ACOCRX_00450 [Candidatus Woesearchaeota archaeon]